MEDQILKLKKLNAAYIAALEWDYCPEQEKHEEVSELFETGITTDQLKETLYENSGRRPDEISREMSDLILTL